MQTTKAQGMKRRQLQEYNVAYVNKLVKELVTDLLMAQPEDAVGFMIDR
jgi:hypothetical protein